MCNINVFMRKHLTQQNRKSEVESFAYACAHSFVGNSDMEGLYISHTNKMYGSEWKISLQKYWKSLVKSHLIIDHTRISTSGAGFANCQPFTDGRFAFCHNGILTLHGTHDLKSYSDSRLYFQKLSKELLKGSVAEAIKATHDDLVSGGSYSMFLYDSAARVGYYWKNSSTSMIMLGNSNSIILSTNDGSDYLFPTHKKKEIKAGVLHVFQYHNNELQESVQDLDLPVSTWSRSNYGNYGYACDYDYDDAWGLSDPQPVKYKPKGYCTLHRTKVVPSDVCDRHEPKYSKFGFKSCTTCTNYQDKEPDDYYNTGYCNSLGTSTRNTDTCQFWHSRYNVNLANADKQCRWCSRWNGNKQLSNQLSAFSTK